MTSPQALAMIRPMSRLAVLLVSALLLVGSAGADGPPPPGPKDRCAVCGMYVAKYPNWLATVVYEDGSQVFFDGPKDLFKYLLDPARRGPGQVDDAYVADYYTTELIEAEDAFFVIGSDVMGPMGPELVPLRTREQAETFAADHGATKILRYGEVTRDEIPR